MKLQAFNGGLNTRVRPQFIEISQAVEYENIDSDAGSLAPVKLPLDTGTSIQQYSTYYTAKDIWVESSTPRDYLEYEKKLYWSDGIDRPKKFDGSNTYNLGIDLPKAPTISGEFDPDAVNEAKLDVKAESSVGLPAGLQYYALVTIKNNKQSLALHLGVSNRDKVFSVATATSKPEIRPIVDNEVTAKRSITFSEFKGVDLRGGSIVEIYRQYKDKWRLAGTVDKDNRKFKDYKEDISANKELDLEAFGPLKGVYQYVLTSYNSLDGSESGPSELTSEFDIQKSGTIKLSNIEVPQDQQVDKVRVYRIGGNLTEFTLVAELDRGTTEFIDNVRDSDAKRTVLVNYAARPAPSTLAFLTTAYAMLFGAEDTKLRFTPVGKPNDWPEEYFLRFEAPITGIAPVATGLLVFTRYKTYIVSGTGPTTLSQHLLSGDQGCITNASIRYLGAQALWVSEDGVCTSSGGLPTVLTKNLLGKIDLDPISSAVFDEVYYVLNSDGSMLALDRGIAKKFNFGFDYLYRAKGKFYGRLDGKLAEVFASDKSAYFKYKSGKLTEGSFVVNKAYKKLFTYSSGFVKINIIINDEVVQTKELTNTDSFTIQVPQPKQRGFYIQFEIEGTGEISELEYSVGV